MACAAIALASAGSLAFGCADLFHSFDDLKNACGATEACVDDAGIDAPSTPRPDASDSGGAKTTDFCAWSRDEARDHARHACAWLGACESPMGNNQFGECLVNAVLAYDCQANPDMQVRGALHAYWDRLWQARSCADVAGVTFTGAKCDGERFPFSACLTGGTVLEGKANTRIECLDAGGVASGERCLVSGQVCTRREGQPTSGQCLGTDTLACRKSRCEEDVLHVCDDGGVDLGRDCKFFGAARCSSISTLHACVPESDAGCTVSPAITCERNVASACRTGREERVSCEAILPGSTCVARGLTADEPVSNGCVVRIDGGDAGRDAEAGAPALDRCEQGGAVLVSSPRGAALSVTCASVGLGACAMVPTASGARAACARPKGS